MLFNLKEEVVVEFLFGDQRRKVAEAETRESSILQSEKPGFSIYHSDRRHFEMKFVHNRRPVLRIGKQVMKPLVKVPSEKGCIYFS